MAKSACIDSALPIADDQTISQPYIVALMAALAELTVEQGFVQSG